MIRNITGGQGIQVSGSVYNSPYVDSTRTSAGMLRYINNNLEVYDGSSWLPLQSSYPTIELDGVTQEAIQWTRRRMEEEKRILELAAKHPTVADALAAVKKAQEQLDIVVTMVTV